MIYSWCVAGVDLCQEPVDEVGERLYGVACVRWAADQRVLHEHVDRVEAAGAEQHAAVRSGAFAVGGAQAWRQLGDGVCLFTPCYRQRLLSRLWQFRISRARCNDLKRPITEWGQAGHTQRALRRVPGL